MKRQVGVLENAFHTVCGERGTDCPQDDGQRLIPGDDKPADCEVDEPLCAVEFEEFDQADPSRRPREHRGVRTRIE